MYKRVMKIALRMIVLGLLTLAVLAAFAIWFPLYDEERLLWMAMEYATGSYSTVLRDVVLIVTWVFAVFVGLPLVIWRSWMTHRQLAATLRQARTAERGLLNERYQKGAEMLGSGTPATRFGGIAALERLAGEHVRDHHIQIMSLLCAFVKGLIYESPTFLLTQGEIALY